MDSITVAAVATIACIVVLVKYPENFITNKTNNKDRQR